MTAPRNYYRGIFVALIMCGAMAAAPANSDFPTAPGTWQMEPQRLIASYRVTPEDIKHGELDLGEALEIVVSTNIPSPRIVDAYLAGGKLFAQEIGQPPELLADRLTIVPRRSGEQLVAHRYLLRLRLASGTLPGEYPFEPVLIDHVTD